MLQFHWPLSDVTTGGGGQQMNTFEQVSNDHHQMSLAGGTQVWCPERGTLPDLFREGGSLPDLSQGGCPTTWPIPWCISCYHPTHEDKCLWKHYPPANVFAGGNKQKCITLSLSRILCFVSVFCRWCFIKGNDKERLPRIEIKVYLTGFLLMSLDGLLHTDCLIHSNQYTKLQPSFLENQCIW